MCITEQTHDSAHLHIRLTQEQDYALVLIMLTACITLTYYKMRLQ